MPLFPETTQRENSRAMPIRIAGTDLFMGWDLAGAALAAFTAVFAYTAR